MTAREYELIGMLNRAATSANGSANWLDMLREAMLNGHAPRDQDLEEIRSGLAGLVELVDQIGVANMLIHAAPEGSLSGRPLGNSADGASEAACVSSGKDGE